MVGRYDKGYNDSFTLDESIKLSFEKKFVGHSRETNNFNGACDPH